MSKATLRLERCYKGDDYTIGTLSVNGLKFCDTLEPKDRGLSDGSTLAAVKAAKANGKTAIPTGSYTVTLGVVSPRFKARNWAKANGGCVPRLLSVKGFDGVLIHPGNTVADTQGCILIGNNSIKGKLTDSVTTYLMLFERLKQYDEITLTIR